MVTAVDGVYIPSVDGSFPERPHTLLASASVDSTVKIWQRNEGEEAFQLLQSISFGNGFALDVALAIFPVSHGKGVFLFHLCFSTEPFVKYGTTRN